MLTWNSLKLNCKITGTSCSRGTKDADFFFPSSEFKNKYVRTLKKKLTRAINKTRLFTQITWNTTALHEDRDVCTVVTLSDQEDICASVHQIYIMEKW